MLVDIIEGGTGYWEFKGTDGLQWGITMGAGIIPIEVIQEVDSKIKMKTIIKLKEAGFTADEIIDLSKADLLFTMGD